MSDLNHFPAPRRWPLRQPEPLQPHSLPPYGVKVSILLGGFGLPFEARRVAVHLQDHKPQEFAPTGPKHRIPARIDPQGPVGKPIALFVEHPAVLRGLAVQAAPA
jgi:GST-like protein